MTSTDPSFLEQFLMAFMSAGAILTGLAGVILGLRGRNKDLQPTTYTRSIPVPAHLTPSAASASYKKAA